MTEPDIREAAIRVILAHVGQVLLRAGANTQARRLLATPVKVEARLACVFRNLRTVEQSLHATWGLSWLGPTLRGRAIEALALARAAAIATISDSEAGPWLCKIEGRARRILIGVGGIPHGTIGAELRTMQEGAEDDHETDTGDGPHDVMDAPEGRRPAAEEL